MSQQHPIPPPPKLVQQWIRERDGLEHLATQAAQWGADQELEAFQTWLACKGYRSLASDLLAARRPKPPSLKKQALHELNDVYNRDKIEDSTYDTIRRALEQL